MYIYYQTIHEIAVDSILKVYQCGALSICVLNKLDRTLFGYDNYANFRYRILQKFLFLDSIRFQDGSVKVLYDLLVSSQQTINYNAFFAS